VITSKGKTKTNTSRGIEQLKTAGQRFGLGEGNEGRKRRILSQIIGDESIFFQSVLKLR
jgi:hypothetical protein